MNFFIRFILSFCDSRSNDLRGNVFQDALHSLRQAAIQPVSVCALISAGLPQASAALITGRCIHYSEGRNPVFTQTVVLSGCLIKPGMPKS
jgi:hypothetical protein